MLVQPAKKLSTLALIEPDIPDRTQPMLPSGEWGINLAAAQGVFPDKGLQVYIPAWSVMGKGDKIELLLNGDPVDQHVITEETEVGERSTLFVAPHHLQTGSYTLSYRVTRLNQQPETQTPPLKLYVKLEIPGGQDTDPLPGHSWLFMYIPPEIVNGIVDKETAERGVLIIIRAESGSGEPYPHAAVGDVIVLSWGGVYLESAPLTAEQISDPINNPIEIKVEKGTIEQAGDTDASGLAVTFRVRDKVHNYSEDWCKETRIRVSIGTDLLVAPIVKEALNNILDLDALGDHNITVQVWAKAPEFRLGDSIVLKMRGTTEDNEPVEVTAPPQTVDNLPHTYDLTLLNADVRKLAKTQVIFTYHVLRPGAPEPLPSKGQFVNFIGEPKRLAAPIAEDEHQGALDPDLARTRIRIPFDPLIEVGMAIELKWFGTRPDLSTYDPELEWYFPDRDEVEDKTGFSITVDGKHLTTIKGGTLDLSYNLLSDKDEDGNIESSGSRHAALLNVGEPQFELVKPIVQGEQDGALEPKDLPNGVSRLTAPRPVVNPTQARDVVTYSWVGEVTGKKEDSIILNALSANKDVHFNLSAAFVAECIEPNRGKKVTVSYRIWRVETNTTSYSNVLEFLVGEGVAMDPPTIESVKGLPSGAQIPPQSSTSERMFEFSGKAAADQQIELRDNGAFKHRITVTPTGDWTHTLIDQLLGPHSYTLKALYGTEPESDEWEITVTPETGTTLEFLNAPYVVAPDALLTYIELRAVDANGEFVKETPLYVTIPIGFSYADGGTGRREFKTDEFGQVVIKRVKGPDAPSTSYTIKAELEGKAVTANLNVTARGKIGELDIGFVSNPIAVSPDGTKICAIRPSATNGQLFVIDTLTLQTKEPPVTNLDGYNLAIGPDSNQIFISSTYRGARIINLATGEQTEIQLGNDDDWGACVWNLEGTHVYLSSKSRIAKVDILLKNVKNIYGGFKNNYEPILLSPDGRHIFTFIYHSSSHLRIWSFDTGSDAPIKTGPVIYNGKGYVISPDGRHIYISFTQERKIKVFETTNLSETRSGDTFNPGAIAISPDGRLLYVGSEDAKVRALDTTNFQMIRFFDVADNPRSLVLSPDGSRLYISYENKTVITALQIE